MKTSGFWEIYMFAVLIGVWLVMANEANSISTNSMIIKSFIVCEYSLIALSILFVVVQYAKIFIEIAKYIKTWKHLFYLPFTCKELKDKNINNLLEYMIYLNDKLSFFNKYTEKTKFVKIPEAIRLQIQKAINENFDSSHLKSSAWIFDPSHIGENPLTYFDEVNIATYQYWIVSFDDNAPQLKQLTARP